jgi:hypothetical protein
MVEAVYRAAGKKVNAANGIDLLSSSSVSSNKPIR